MTQERKSSHSKFPHPSQASAGALNCTEHLSHYKWGVTQLAAWCQASATGSSVFPLQGMDLSLQQSVSSERFVNSRGRGPSGQGAKAYGKQGLCLISLSNLCRCWSKVSFTTMLSGRSPLPPHAESTGNDSGSILVYKLLQKLHSVDITN